MTSRLRALANAPGFSILVITVLAFGIGAATAFFSVVDAILFQPLRSDTAGRIVAIQTAWPRKGQVTPRVSGGDFLDLRSSTRCFSALAVYNGGELGVQIGKGSRFARVFKADPSFFSVLNVPTVAGRLPNAADHDSAQTAVVTTSFAIANWGDTKVGGALSVENRSYTVAGIINDGYAFPEGTQVWITGPINPENQNHTAFNYRAIARLKPGVSIAQAQAELSRIHEQDRGLWLLSLRDAVAGPARTTLLFLFAATALLLLIACANAANLMLARTAQRNHEIAVRISLGSSVRQLFRLIALESLMLTGMATVMGIVIAYAALHAIYPLLPASLPRSAEVLHMHPAVLTFAFLACCFTVLACSIVPLFYLRGVEFADLLKQYSARFVGGSRRTRHITVAAQVALSCVLCVGAVLLSRSLIALNDARLGFNPSNVTVMYADAPAFQLAEYMRAIQTYEALIGTVERIPGVGSAAAIMGLPTGRYGSNGYYWVEGVHIQPGEDLFKTNWTGRALPYANFAVTTGGYFKTVGIPLLAGRDFSEHDRYDGPFTAIISKSLAQHSFGPANPIGRRLYCGLDSPKPMTIIGVVGDVRQDSPASPMEPAIYMPLQQHPFYANEVEIVVRAHGDAHGLIPLLRQVTGQQAPGVAIEFTTLSDMVYNSIAPSRFRAILSIAFAVIAAILAVAGIYAVLLFEANQQRSEIGVRMALGAAPVSIMALVMRRAFVMCSAGLIFGLAAAVMLSRFVSSIVYGIEILDPLTYYLGAASALLFIAVAAAGPAWRASRVDPAVALRSD